MLYRTCCHEFRDSPFPIVLCAHCAKEKTETLFKHLTWNLNYYVIWLFGWYSWQEWVSLTILSSLPSNCPQLFLDIYLLSAAGGAGFVLFSLTCVCHFIFGSLKLFIKNNIFGMVFFYLQVCLWHRVWCCPKYLVMRSLNCWNGY